MGINIININSNDDSNIYKVPSNKVAKIIIKNIHNYTTSDDRIYIGNYIIFVSDRESSNKDGIGIIGIKDNDDNYILHSDTYYLTEGEKIYSYSGNAYINITVIEEDI